MLSLLDPAYTFFSIFFALLNEINETNETNETSFDDKGYVIAGFIGTLLSMLSLVCK